MSDEASGPEDEALESKVDWKRRMAQKVGRTNLEDAELEKMEFFENIEPNWRSSEMTDMYRELRGLWYSGVSA